MRRQLGFGVLAACFGLAALLLAAAVGPAGASSWVILGSSGIVLAIHPWLRFFHMVAVAAVLFLAAVRAGVSGLPLPAAAGLGLALLGYVLTLDLASAVRDESLPAGPLARAWLDAVTIPLAAGLGGTAVAVVAASLPLPPSLPLALAGLAALVIVGAIALRGPTSTGTHK